MKHQPVTATCEQCENIRPLVRYRSALVCASCEIDLTKLEKQDRGAIEDFSSMGITDYDFDLRSEMRDDDYDY